MIFIIIIIIIVIITIFTIYYLQSNKILILPSSQLMNLSPTSKQYNYPTLISQSPTLISQSPTLISQSPTLISKSPSLISQLLLSPSQIHSPSILNKSLSVLPSQMIIPIPSQQIIDVNNDFKLFKIYLSFITIDDSINVSSLYSQIISLISKYLINFSNELKILLNSFVISVPNKTYKLSLNSKLLLLSFLTSLVRIISDNDIIILNNYISNLNNYINIFIPSIIPSIIPSEQTVEQTVEPTVEPTVQQIVTKPEPNETILDSPTFMYNLLYNSINTMSEWITGCKCENLTELTDAGEPFLYFNNINTSQRYRDPILYFPKLIVLARVGQTLSLTV